MDEIRTRPPSRRFVIIGGLAVAAIVGFFVLLPCALREVSSRAVQGRDISFLRQIDSAVRVYHLDRGRYPASLDAPDFRPYIDESAIAFLREGRLAYHAPAADSPPTFI